MTTSIKHLDDVSLEKVLLNCSDLTIAYLMISLNTFDCDRVMNHLSAVHKTAIQAELKLLEASGYSGNITFLQNKNSRSSVPLDEKRIGIGLGIQEFWEMVRLLEAQGEIIVRKQSNDLEGGKPH